MWWKDQELLQENYLGSYASPDVLLADLEKQLQYCNAPENPENQITDFLEKS